MKESPVTQQTGGKAEKKAVFPFSFCHARNQTQSLTHARYVLCHSATYPTLYFPFFSLFLFRMGKRLGGGEEFGFIHMN